ncbi:MAG: methyltransferase domain-containing protein [Rhodospirillales bacterium]|nr:methyltransferase domain-containing protein [Rhodospirillales bacterium]
MSDKVHENQYSDAFIASTEMVCGEGYMSPGGDQSVARILDGLDIGGKKVLEIGCGLGGGLIALARNHHADSVHGIDLEQYVLDKAQSRIDAANLGGTVSLECVKPGPFPIANNTYDIVVCKEMLCHIEDKPSFYREILRVIKPGGYLIGSDWLSSHLSHQSEEYKNWLLHLKQAGMTFHFASHEETVEDLQNVNFENVSVTDNSRWISDINEQHIERVHGSAKQDLKSALGDDGYQALISRTQNRITALENGTLLHCNLRAQKSV